MRKISIIAPDLVAGGMTRAYALAQALVHIGYDVEIFGINITSKPVYPMPPSNIKVTEVNGGVRLCCLLRLMARLDGEVLYAIKPRISSYGVALLKRSFSRSPVILDIDDWESALLNEPQTKPAVSASQPPALATAIIGLFKRWGRVSLRRCRRWPNPTDARYRRWMENLIYKADAVTVNTRALQSLYGGTYVFQCKDACRYAPERYPPEDSRRRYGLSGYIVLMFPGTARPHKGLEDILAAMDALRIPELRLVIVGGRSASENYMSRLMSRWGHWVVRLPAFSQEQMPDVIAAAHIIVVPQRDTAIARAQFPIKLTDGMAMAKPVITTTVGDIPEIIGDSGYLVAPSSPGQLAQAIRKILDDPQAALDRGGKARDRLVRSYSLDALSPVLSGIVEGLKPTGKGKIRTAPGIVPRVMKRGSHK